MGGPGNMPLATTQPGQSLSSSYHSSLMYSGSPSTISSPGTDSVSSINVWPSAILGHHTLHTKVMIMLLCLNIELFQQCSQFSTAMSVYNKVVHALRAYHY